MMPSRGGVKMVPAQTVSILPTMVAPTRICAIGPGTSIKQADNARSLGKQVGDVFARSDGWQNGRPGRRSFRAGCRCMAYARDGSREGKVSGANVPLRNLSRHPGSYPPATLQGCSMTLAIAKFIFFDTTQLAYHAVAQASRGC